MKDLINDGRDLSATPLCQDDNNREFVILSAVKDLKQSNGVSGSLTRDDIRVTNPYLSTLGWYIRGDGVGVKVGMEHAPSEGNREPVILSGSEVSL